MSQNKTKAVLGVNEGQCRGLKEGGRIRTKYRRKGGPLRSLGGVKEHKGD